MRVFLSVIFFLSSLFLNAQGEGNLNTRLLGVKNDFAELAVVSSKGQVLDTVFIAVKYISYEKEIIQAWKWPGRHFSADVFSNKRTDIAWGFLYKEESFKDKSSFVYRMSANLIEVRPLLLKDSITHWNGPIMIAWIMMLGFFAFMFIMMHNHRWVNFPRALVGIIVTVFWVAPATVIIFSETTKLFVVLSIAVAIVAGLKYAYAKKLGKT